MTLAPGVIQLLFEGASRSDFFEGKVFELQDIGLRLGVESQELLGAERPGAAQC